MSLTLDLPTDIEKRLRAEAARKGIPLHEMARHLIAEGLPEEPWGAKVVAMLREQGAMWDDRPETSEELAAEFHRMAEQGYQ